MPSPKRQRVEGQQRLYLIFDDWAWGYSIREINLLPLMNFLGKRTCPDQRHQKTSPSASGKGTMRRLPRPFIQLEALRGDPVSFAAIGTKIVATHYSTKTATTYCGECAFMPIVDVRSRGVNFGPGQKYHSIPIYITVGDRLFSLDIADCKVLSFEPLRAPKVGDFLSKAMEPRWVWHDLPMLPFERENMTSYALHPDEHTILVSTGEATYALDTSKLSTKTVCVRENGYGFVPKNQDTFALDTGDVVPIDADSDMGQDMWKRLGEWPLSFTGRAHFVHCLNAFVGLSKDPATVGHLCCEAMAVDGPPATKLSKEKFFSKNPAETHVGATLLYMGGAEFCLVQCVSIENGNTIDPEEVLEFEEQQDVDDGSTVDCGALEGLQPQDKDSKQEDTIDSEGLDEELEEQQDIDCGELERLQPQDKDSKKEDTIDRKGLDEELQQQQDSKEEEAIDHERLEEQQQEYITKEGDSEKLKEGGEKTQGCRSYIYRLTTFSLCYDDNQDLSTADTCTVQCYKVPEETTKEFLHVDPVAFWL